MLRWSLLILAATLLLLAAAGAQACFLLPYMELDLPEPDSRPDGSVGVDAWKVGRLPGPPVPVVTVIPVVDVHVLGVPPERAPPPVPPVPVPGGAPPAPSVPPVPDPFPRAEGGLEPLASGAAAEVHGVVEGDPVGPMLNSTTAPHPLSVPGLDGPLKEPPGAPPAGMDDAVPSGRPADADVAAPPLDLAAGALFSLPAGAVAWLRGRGRRG